MSLNIEKEVATLEQMTVGQLHDRYVEVFGERVRSRHKQYLIRRIAWRLQANAEGGLSERALRRAEELADDADVRLTPPRGVTENQKAPFGTDEAKSDMSDCIRVHVMSDSSYVLQGITEWIHGWKRNGWRRRTQSGYKPVKNVEYWQQLDNLVKRHAVSFEHVRGHSGHPENERCDKLAVDAYRKLMESGNHN